MKKRNIFYGSILLFSGLGALLISMVSNPQIFAGVKGQGITYSLTLDSSKKITNNTTPSTYEELSSIYTNQGNDIQIKYSNIINYSLGWQTILPNGYFYNLATSVGDNNKLSGMESVSYEGNGSLEFHYGYLLNNEDIIYSFSKTINAGETFEINECSPSYFYFKNTTSSNVDISSLSISYSCSAQSYPMQNLKVLMIGNSFADDTVCYAARIANGYGINLEIYDAYIGKCDIDKHYNNIVNDNATYSMRSMNGSNWNYQDNKTLTEIIQYKTWDIITFQQASAQIGREGTYSNLANLVDEVKDCVNGSPRYYWYQTWSYDNDYSDWEDYFSYFNNNSNTMFNAIVERYHEDVEPLHLFEKTIYSGTAVQNMRTSYMKETFSRDGKHLSNCHGRYLLGANLVSNLFEIDLDLSPIKYIPDGMNRSYLNVVNESIKNAHQNPDIISQSLYQETEMGDYDLSGYTEIDAEIVGCSFWNCTDSSNYNKRINHTSGTSNIYCSTKRFTASTLPVGSLVFCQEGFGYRPEAWTNDAQQSSRKSESYANVLEINDSFWNGYAYRAFNLFKSGKQKLADEYVNEQYDEIFDGFHIYVPNDKMSEYGLLPKGTNNSRGTDYSLFSNNGLDIDNYERIHLDPITGFYKCDSYYYLMNSFVDSTAQKFVCTRPFFTVNGDLPSGTVLIVDSGYQWRSDCWKEKATCTRPSNVSTQFTVLDNSFMSQYRMRTFNVSRTDGYSTVGQNSIDFINHFRIYVPIS